MVEPKPIVEQLTNFNKIIDDLVNIKVTLDDEDKVLLLLCGLPRPFNNFKGASLYEKHGIITLDEVQSILRTKKLTKFKDLKVENSEKVFNVSGGRGEGKGKWVKSKSIGGDKLKWSYG